MNIQRVNDSSGVFFKCCARETLKVFIKKADPDKGAVPGAVIAIQSFGKFLSDNPHVHILLTDGCFHENGITNRNFSRTNPPALVGTCQKASWRLYFGGFFHLYRHSA